jgi:hypothetical protein
MAMVPARSSSALDRRYSLFRDGTGCDVMRRLWSEYLRWKEQ